MRWRSPAAIVNYRAIFLTERMLDKDSEDKYSVEKKNAGRES
jgi:hypothetical protein